MTNAEIYKYQMSMKEWDKNAEFVAYELLELEEFNDEFSKHGADGFFKIYDYSELTAVVIIKNMMGS